MILRVLAAAILWWHVNTLSATEAAPRVPPPTALQTTAETAAARLGGKGGIVLAEIDAAGQRYSAFGNPAPRDGVPTEKILFEIGSITKVFTGLLLAQTVLEHKATLTDSIGQYLPAELALDPRLAAITLEQLATHTSGLPRMPTNFPSSNPDDPYADYSPELLYDFLRSHHPAHAAPQPSEYSNLGVGLLGHVLERIYGRSYEQLLRERISGPLGMNDTVITLTDEQRTRFATPFADGHIASPWHLAAMAPAGAIRSTLADMTTFARALMDPRSPLAPAWQLAREPRVAQGMSRVGLNIMVRQRGDETVYWHNGGTGGFRTHFEIVPATGRAVLLFINHSGPVDPRTVVDTALMPKSTVAAREERSTTGEQLVEYTAVYDIDGRSKFTVVVDPENRLNVRLSGQTFGPVSYGGNDVFFSKAHNAEFHFQRGADGKVATLKLHQRGNVIPARRTGDAPSVIFLTSEKAAEYTGLFEFSETANFVITNRGRWVYAKLGLQPALPVFCDAPDHFVYEAVEAALTFERDASGAVTALVLHQNGADKRAPKKARAAAAK
jgi:D-alanyl-D-alanine-carboxypeptidase/D-alanyl-D-alanine-endopeptidase